MATRSLRSPSRLRLLRPALLALALAAPVASPARAAAPAVLADVGAFTSLAIGAVPGDGYLLVWQEVPSLSLKVRRISAAGFPVGAEKTVLPLSEPVENFSVAVAPSGAWVVFWDESAGADQVSLGAAYFDAQDRFLRRVSYPDPLPDPGGLIISESPGAVALPGGGYAVAFTVGMQTNPGGDPINPSDTDVWVLRVGADGQEVGSPRRLNEETAGFQSASGIGVSAAGVVVSWGSFNGETREVRARALSLDLAPLSGEIHVSETPLAGPSGLAVETDGRFLVLWQQAGDPARLLVRAFGPGGSPLGEEQALNAGETGQGLAGVAVTRTGTVWVSWIAAADPAHPDDRQIFVRPFDLAGTPQAAGQAIATFEGTPPPLLIGGESGALLAWRPQQASSQLLGLVVGQAAGSGTPPADLALESPELPGFRVWVRISARPTDFLWGTQTAPCLAEALCVAGALPDRAEVIVRVIGPKPNGFLWPLIVKLSTSQAEVWLQQKAGGAVKYYLLPGATPGDDTLPGLFDRTGFRP